jgi:hypothetical protein
LASRKVTIGRIGPDFGVTKYASSAFQFMRSIANETAHKINCGDCLPPAPKASHRADLHLAGIDRRDTPREVVADHVDEQQFTS